MLRLEGGYHRLRFSEHKPGSERPRRISKESVRAAVNDGWNVDAIRVYHSNSTLTRAVFGRT